jgi:hypothetical protein
MAKKAQARSTNDSNREAAWIILQDPMRLPGSFQTGEPGQAEWHARERLRGGLVWVVGSFEAFEEAYDREFGWMHAEERGR